MQCVTPMFRRYRIGEHSKGIIVPRSEVLENLNYDKNYIRLCLDKINKASIGIGFQYEMIPCQHCYGCLIKKSAEWATRCMLESQYYDHAYFITLTYDDEHIVPPANPKSNFAGTLYPDDVTQFIDSIRHDLRKQGIKDVKYLYCGEYGQGTGAPRPHYHMLLFGVPLDWSENYDYYVDKQFFKEHFKNPYIEKYWDKGLIDISVLEWNNAAYTARYCVKKIFENESDYDNEGVFHEFIRMSNGIGKRYYEENKDNIYKSDNILMKNIHGKTCNYKPPKYFDKMFSEERPTEMWEIKYKRKKTAERSRKVSYTKSDYSDLERLQIEEEKITTKAKQLKRDM